MKCPANINGHSIDRFNNRCGYCHEYFVLVPNTALTAIASKATAVVNRLDELNLRRKKVGKVAREIEKEAFALIRSTQ